MRTSIIAYLTVGLAICANASLAADNAGSPTTPSYGTADYVPSHEQPISYRAGNGAYPGAEPPLEWWDGTPTNRQGEVKYKGKKESTQQLPDFADNQAKNILWKVPSPGWGLSHPIVVGKKVFTVGHPYFLACHDADTGKELWKRTVWPTAIDGSMIAKEAEQVRTVCDLAAALFILSDRWAQVGANPHTLFYDSRSHPLDFGTEEEVVAAKHVAATKALAMIAKYRADVEAIGDPDLVKALDADVACIEPVRTVPDFVAWKEIKSRSLNLVNACQKKWGIQIFTSWTGYVGRADSTPASDGERVYVVMDMGQVAAYDLEGNLVWGFFEQGGHDNRQTFHRSPRLCGDVLVVRSVSGGNKRRAPVYRGFDKRTGKVLWETAYGGAPNYEVGHLVRLPAVDGKGPAASKPKGEDGMVDVFVTCQGAGNLKKGEGTGLAMIRVSDGKLLGTTPPHFYGRNAMLSVHGDIIAYGGIVDGGSPDSAAVRLRMTGPDSAAGEVLWIDKERSKPFYAAEPSTAWGRWRLSKNKEIVEIEANKVVGKLPVKFDTAGVVLAGHYLIGQVTKPEHYGRGRDDHKAIGQFAVIDVADPTQPKLVAENNLLGFSEPQVDHYLQTYLAEFPPLDFAGCYRGSDSSFGAEMGGILPHGKRLYIKTSAWLYCIGER